MLYQAKNAVDLLYLKYLKAQISYDGINRVETYPYPKEAIREAVLNAIAHKNYERQVPIQIKVFDDKIIIGNTCVFPEGCTEKSLFEKHSSVPYNPLIAKTLYRAGFIESQGRGIEKIVEACEKEGNPLPKYTVNPNEIMVIFYSIFDKDDPINTGDYTKNDTVNDTNVGQSVGNNDPKDIANDIIKLTVKDRQRNIVDLMLSNPKITRLELSEILSVSDATIKRDIDKLKKSEHKP
ncbi:MAG: hypothetical protein CSB55_04365 [Candidatus Cloacimonadota bacterium]|nr:MAG: hypothetical protein CSB55_04365 [Candidatus Cloacimonadota bacterium]